MPQKTNLNISPYYDDFDKADNFYKVLFKPGFPVQARELTTLQSILQSQVESFGSHIFKEGSMVIPGGVTYDSTYFSVKVNPDHLGIDVTVYLDALINNNNGKGTKVVGQNSQIVGTIKNYVLPPNEGVDDITIFVKYNESGVNSLSEMFPHEEILTLKENVTYGNTTLNAGETVLTVLSEDATATGSAFGVDNGIYFIRGTFVDVQKSLIVLEPYSNKPSYRVGFEILETIVTSNDDPSLNDNAKGFTNYAAPGADRFKISVKLAKKALLDYEDTNFVELMRVRDGEIKKLQAESVYSHIEKWIAGRTYDESGNYAIQPFRVNLQNSLNDEISSNGLFVEGQKTDDGADPSDDLMCVKLSSGRAYVRGFDVDVYNKVIDVEKPRDTKTVNVASVPFRMGSLLKVNNVEGIPWANIGGSTANIVGLYNRRKGTGNVDPSTNGPTGSNAIKIGDARVYSFNVSDSAYTDDSTEWDLHLYDIQTYTILQISNPGTDVTSTVPLSSRVRGLSSGAIGYVANHTGNPNEISLSQTTGSFVQGEVLIFNEKTTSTNCSVLKVLPYAVDDIKSVWQDADTLDSSLVSDFSADSVLYDRVLPNFSKFDALTVTGATNGNSAAAVSPRRRFAGKVGIKTDSIVGYSTDVGGQTYNRVAIIQPDGSTLQLQPVVDVSGVNSGRILAGVTTSNTFRIKSPKIINLNNSGLYARLPKRNVSAVDFSNSTLLIKRQVTGKTPSTGTLSISTSDALDVGITSAFFEPFDVENYSIHYNNGTVEPLTSDQVVITNGGNDISFSGLTANLPCTIGVTLKKVGLITRSKDYIRSSKLEITRTVGVSTNSGLDSSNFYGLRVEDSEISLNVPDVVKIHAVYESKNIGTATLDKLTFVSGLALNTNTIVGEKIVGKSSRAIGQVVNRVSATEIEFVYLNDNTFSKGETINFKESNIETNLQKITLGNYTNKTSNYILDKGHKKQYSDYSKLVRKNNVSIPSNRLLVIFDYYKTQNETTGDVFSANSYTKDRYTTDIPFVERDRGTDILDFRPRVNPFDPSVTSGTPFDFNNRTFESITKYVVAPNHSSIVGYTYYLPRIDKLVIDKFGAKKLIKGVSADYPAPPTEIGPSMEVAEITLPPYLYDPIKDPKIRLYDNKRYTMRDIGKLEKRINNLEEMTSLTALESDTKSLQVTDADGLDRFKTGFVVNDFKDRNFIDFNRSSGSRCDVDIVNKELISAVDFWSLQANLAYDPAIDANNVDSNANIKLLDPNCQKTGDLITLKYDQVASEIKNLQATQVENINPFNVIVFAGSVQLDPPSDNWTRTIYIDNFREESSGATWAEEANVVKDETNSVTDINVTEVEVPPIDAFRRIGNHRDITTTRRTTTTRTKETSFTNVLENEGREFDYVESIKINGITDPFMRSRNVGFNANGLKPFTKHYSYLDSGIPDLFPKLTEIEMSSGTFTVNEDAIVFKNGKEIAVVRLSAPNHKYGVAVVAMSSTASVTTSSVNITGGSAETYQVDVFDRDRPAPSDLYSATSRILNVDTVALANNSAYYGYINNGCTVVGQTSGATATVTNANIYSDNWGDILGTFFFRNSNAVPAPPNLFRTGTKTFKVTAAPVGTVTLPGSTAMASDATGTYYATGTILTQTSNIVGVRNPPEPAQRPNETSTEISVNEESETERIEAPYRDPLAQSFRVDETGMFLTSVDVYFASKDPAAKVFVEIRDVELGTPTNFLVQDYAQVALNPGDIQTSTDASIATNIRFPSPVYLEAGKEYALVFLSPSSDLYEMWCSTMGQKTVKTANLPDVESVVHTKQYIGGSLFKSQNGTIWTPSQYQDLTFQLYKAAFVPSGTVTFYNDDIDAGYANTQVLSDNPVRTLPRKLKVKVTGLTAADAPVGRKLSTGATTDKEDVSITGIVEKVAAPIATATQPEIVLGGAGYEFTNQSSDADPVANTIPIKSINGDGSGATASITIDGTTGAVKLIENITAGSRFTVGDVVTIDNESGLVSKGAGATFAIKEIAGTIDTVYLTDVQGEVFKNGDAIIHYGTNNDTRTTATGASVSGDSEVLSDLNTGNVIEIIQPNHAHHGTNNKIKIKGIEPDSVSTETTTALNDETLVGVGNTIIFTQFAGITTDRGEALIESEVVSYVVGSGQLIIDGRGLGGSVKTQHPTDVSIQPYEINGFPLVGINSTLNVPANTTLKNASNIDNYYLEIDRGTGPRSENVADNKTLVCFTTEKGVGGNTVGISQNHQYSTLSPELNAITPGKGTRLTTSVRTVSGTSADGNEVSFIDQGFEPTILNETTFFPTPRLCASKINEVERLQTLPKNKSIALKIDMTSTDKNLSPVLDTKYATFVLGRNKINNPVSDYITDTRSNTLVDDPHGSVFVSKKVTLKQPATSLKVFVAGNVQPEADFRVFYRLFTADSSEVSQTYRAFPGHKNLIDTDGDGFGDDIIDLGLNDGTADAYVKPNGLDDFSEYQFTMNDLESFDGFTIKIVMTSTNECVPVRLKDFRAIALA